jgi:hypothetical protein
MIIRRLAEAIREQNWFTVFIELLVVVVGIFLGLQFDNWNDNRLAALDENQFLIRARAELTQTIADRQGALVSKRDVNRRLSFALETLEKGVLKDADREAFEDALSTIGAGDTFNLNIAVFGNPERLQLLNDSDIRSAINLYDDRVQDVLDRNKASLAIAIDMFTELTRRFTWKQPTVEEWTSVTGFTWYDFNDLAADRSFYNRLGIFYGSHWLRTIRLEDVIAETEKLISTLDAAIAARGIALPKAPE